MYYTMHQHILYVLYENTCISILTSSFLIDSLNPDGPHKHTYNSHNAERDNKREAIRQQDEGPCKR